MKKVKLYALSTCGWCKKTKTFLDQHAVDYECEYVDLLSGETKEKCLAELEKWNPRRNFPTVVIDDNIVVVGYREEQLREALNL